jgi:hypothetical protein
MWLEEMAWLWLPVVGGVGIWVVWSTLALKAEVRALRQRLEHTEAGMTSRHHEEQKVAV